MGCVVWQGSVIVLKMINALIIGKGAKCIASTVFSVTAMGAIAEVTDACCF